MCRYNCIACDVDFFTCKWAFFVFDNRSLGLIDASIHVIQLLQKLENDLESLLIGKYWATAATTVLQIIPQKLLN